MAGEKVLIVEDDRGLVPLFNDLVRQLGYTVAGNAASGEEAVASAS